MNIISPKQVNELDILNEQDKKNIQNLLKKRKNFKKQKSTDPIYSELYVIHEQNKNNKDKKRSKTERDYQSEHSKVHNYPKEKIVGSEIKNHKRSFTSSYSVQLPPVSKLFQSKAKHGNKNQGARAILPSSYIPKKISLPHYQSVILQQNESEKHQMRSVHQKRKYQTIAIQNQGPKQPKKKQMKIRVNSFPTKQRKPSNYGQWKQIDILKLETYFIKLKKNKNLLFSQSRIDNLQQSSQSKNMIPSDIRKVPDFIKSYESTNPDVNINNLIKSTKFGVVFDEGLSLYFGELQKGSKSGYGVLICNNYRFQGLFRNDQKIIGYELTLNGYYRGKFHNNKRQGTGQYIWFNGQSYSGQWKNGVKQGSGVWKSGRGDSYIGQWHNGKVQGYGVHLSSTGQRYEGNFCEFLKSGKGQETFPNGDVYIGEYNQGEANGRGKYVWKNGIIYEGYFKNGYRNGKGILNAQGYLNFQGYFKNDLPNGNGSLNYENGDHYIGSFLDGQKHGQGTLKLKVQQKVLTGEWQRGKFKFQQQQN